MSLFELHAPYQATGDQPEAIEQLVRGLERGDKHQVLLGATGTGKTFTVASLIARAQRPALVLAHNKTLGAQLYAEFRDFFPANAVEYFVSSRLPARGLSPAACTSRETDIMGIDRLRLSATARCSRRAWWWWSVSCIYIGSGGLRPGRAETAARAELSPGGGPAAAGRGYRRNNLQLGRLLPRAGTPEYPAYGERSCGWGFGDELEGSWNTMA
jgi:excinuclease ABC subunit B